MRVEITTSVSPPMTSPPSWRSTSETWDGQAAAVEELVEAEELVVEPAAAAAVDGQAEAEADLRRYMTY